MIVIVSFIFTAHCAEPPKNLTTDVSMSVDVASTETPGGIEDAEPETHEEVLEDLGTETSLAEDVTADVSAEVVEEVDASEEVVAWADVPEEVVEEVNASSELSLKFTLPAAGAMVEEGSPFQVVMLTSDLLFGPEELAITLSSDVEGVLATLTPDFAGWAQGEVTLSVAGWHTLTATVVNPAGEVVEASVAVGICSYGVPETFDAGQVGAEWQTFGDASFDSGGWLEMTGNEKGKKGAIFNLGTTVNPGDVEVSFKIWTGGGVNSGADGFAMSVINVPTPADLEQVIASANSGGCLGYGVSGSCGPLQLDAFHIEFDTWENKGDPNQDPTPNNHIAVTLNGDPSDHLLWTAVTLEDATWHDVHIKIAGQNITVSFDQEVVIDGNLPTFQFHGGYLGFSGTTGWATNYHRFDDLWVKQSCDIP